MSKFKLAHKPNTQALPFPSCYLKFNIEGVKLIKNHIKVCSMIWKNILKRSSWQQEGTGNGDSSHSWLTQNSITNTVPM